MKTTFYLLPIKENKKSFTCNHPKLNEIQGIQKRSKQKNMMDKIECAYISVNSRGSGFGWIESLENFEENLNWKVKENGYEIIDLRK